MKKLKGSVLAVLAGATMFSGGCLNLNWQQLLVDAALNVATEFLLDNNNVLDIFPDGPGAE